MIAIHDRPGSFSDIWTDYCTRESIQFKIVNCYASDIIRELADCDALMWHWSHADERAAIFARQLTISLELMGKVVFPNYASSWHFDDKIGQKYLFEAIGAPVPRTWTFYDRAAAMRWISNASYPLIFKLRGGAGSENVHLVEDARGAARLVKRAFSGGFTVKSRRYLFKERLWQWQRDRSWRSLLGLGKGIARLVIPTRAELSFPREKHYVYFQEFVPGVKFDFKIVVIGDQAYAVRRSVREGDFRVSGSGILDYDPSQVPIACVQAAFEVSDRLGSQCLGLDFLVHQGRPVLIEASYGFALYEFPGFWDRSLDWHEGMCVPQHAMVEKVLTCVREARGKMTTSVESR